MPNTQNVQSKIDIAKEYVALHKEFDVPHKGEDSGFESIYHNLFGDLYGSIELIDEESGEYQVEISSRDTKTGNPVLFTFIDPDHKMPNTQDTHELLTDSILDLIELHQNVAPHLVAHALISTGARLARDAAPTPKDAEALIELALDNSGN